MIRKAGVFACVLTLHAETALLECTADIRFDKPGHVLTFRVGAIEHWKIEKAVLMLHVARGPESGTVQLALVTSPWNESSTTAPPAGDAVEANESVKPDHWVAIPVPAAMAQAVADGKASGIAVSGPQTFDSRRTIQFSPFLAVVGVKSSTGTTR